MGHMPQPFRKEYQQKIDEEVKRAREEQDVPFDEIYHKERKLVQEIIRAQKAIKDIRENQPDPAEAMRFNPKDIDEDPVFGDMYSQQDET